MIVKGRARTEVDCRSVAEHDDGAHRSVAECLRDEVFEVVIVEVRARGEKRRDRARRSVVQHQDGDRRSILEHEARNPNMVLVEVQARSSEMARVQVRARGEERRGIIVEVLLGTRIAIVDVSSSTKRGAPRWCS